MSSISLPDLGCAVLEPSTPVMAGSYGTWTLRFTVGAFGVDQGGTIKIAHRFASDWEPPQFTDPTASGYTTLISTGEAILTPRYELKGHIRPYMKALVIDVSGEALRPGDEITLVFGDRTGGSPGMRAQTFQESAHMFRLFVDPTNACLAREIEHSPTLPVIPGPAVKCLCLLPTECTVGEWVEPFLSGEDAWGNPAPVPSVPAVEWSWEGSGETEICGGRLRLRTPGSGWLIARTALGPCHSNPMTARAEGAPLRPYWADLHAQTGTTIGTGTDDEYFAFGRDAARLDVIGHQGNDFQISDAQWHAFQETTRRYHEEGRYVVLPGYEWSANTPCGGDHNVFYRREGQPIFRCHPWQVPDSRETEPAPTLDALFDRLREQVGEADVLVASHVGGRYADMRRPLDDRLAPLVEVASCWGIFEWMIWDSFDHGHRVGIMANSDGHKGRPGREGPGAGEFGIAGGLTCILAESLTRDAIFDALRQRRCYGTTGPRIDLRFTVNGAPMGSLLPAVVSYRVEATVRTVAPLEELVLYAGRERLHIVRPEAFAARADSRRLRIRWGGAASRGRSRRIRWNGVLTVTGNRIAALPAEAFDSPADGIDHHTETEVRFHSGTTGDVDFFDIELEHATHGTLRVETGRGTLALDLSTLETTAERLDCGGLDAFLSVERYPIALTSRQATLRIDLPAERVAGRPLFVRALQSDGALAWASPVYPG